MNMPTRNQPKQTEIGEMPENWEVKPMVQICDIVTDYVANGSFASLKSHVKYSDTPDFAVLIRLADYNSSFQNEFVYINEEGYEFLKKTRLFGGEIIISNVGEYAGTVFRAPHLDRKMTLGPNSIMLKTNQYDSYLYYWLKSNYGQAALRDIRSGSAVPKFNKTDFKTILVQCPPIPEQQQIASVLSALDDKIELNLKMNKTLEEMGKALFKRWFVDFEFPDENGKPYKSSGGEMVESELGTIPRGWKVEPVGNYIDNFDSQRVPLSSREREKRRGIYRYFGATGVMDFIDNYLFDGIYLLIGEDGTVTKEGGFPYTQYVWGKFWVNNHAHTIKAKFPFSTEFMKLFFDSTVITAYITGAVQPKLNQSNLNSIPFIVPNEKLIGGFVDTINKLYSLFRTNEDEINNLVQARNFLLPRLMSGKLRVN